MCSCPERDAVLRGPRRLPRQQPSQAALEVCTSTSLPEMRSQPLTPTEAPASSVARPLYPREQEWLLLLLLFLREHLEAALGRNPEGAEQKQCDIFGHGPTHIVQHFLSNRGCGIRGEEMEELPPSHSERSEASLAGIWKDSRIIRCRTPSFAPIR